MAETTSPHASAHRGKHRQHASDRQEEAEKRSDAELPPMLTPAPTLAGQVIELQSHGEEQDANTRLKARQEFDPCPMRPKAMCIQKPLACLCRQPVGMQHGGMLELQIGSRSCAIRELKFEPLLNLPSHSTFPVQIDLLANKSSKFIYDCIPDDFYGGAGCIKISDKTVDNPAISCADEKTQSKYGWAAHRYWFRGHYKIPQGFRENRSSYNLRSSVEYRSIISILKQHEFEKIFRDSADRTARSVLLPREDSLPNGGRHEGNDDQRSVLPYLAAKQLVWIVRCRRCGLSLAITAAGRADDPRSVTVPCQGKPQ